MISAVAQKYNIHPQTLRLYEREGLLKPSRTDGNTRLYSEEDLEQLETILSLTRDLGVNLAGVEIILNMRRKIERDAARGQRVHGVRQARAGARHRRLGAAAVDRARQIVADRSRARRRRQVEHVRQSAETYSQSTTADNCRVAFRSRSCATMRFDALCALRRHRLEAGRRATACAASSRCDCWRDSVGHAAAGRRATSRSAISTARSPTSPPTTSRSSARSTRRAASPTRFPRSTRQGCCCSRASPASARRTSPSRC